MKKYSFILSLVFLSLIIAAIYYNTVNSESVLYPATALNLPRNYTIQKSIKNGDIVCFCNEVVNLQKLFEFAEKVKKKEKAIIRITNFNPIQTAWITVLNYNGKNIEVTKDSTRSVFSIDVKPTTQIYGGIEVVPQKIHLPNGEIYNTHTFFLLAEKETNQDLDLFSTLGCKERRYFSLMARSNLMHPTKLTYENALDISDYYDADCAWAYGDVIYTNRSVKNYGRMNQFSDNVKNKRPDIIRISVFYGPLAFKILSFDGTQTEIIYYTRDDYGEKKTVRVKGQLQIESGIFYYLVVNKNGKTKKIQFALDSIYCPDEFQQ